MNPSRRYELAGLLLEGFVAGRCKVEPMKPPGTERLRLQYDEPPSNLGFKINLRRYIVESQQFALERQGEVMRVMKTTPL